MKHTREQSSISVQLQSKANLCRTWNPQLEQILVCLFFFFFVRKNFSLNFETFWLKIVKQSIKMNLMCANTQKSRTWDPSK